MNHYPAWKYALLAIVLVIGVVYALPNFYDDDYALQISASSATLDVSQDTVAQIEKVLADAGIASKKIELNAERILVRLNDSGSQLKAQSAVSDALTDQYSVALNLAPATPRWLQALNARPMSLGLDLKGGIHFLMQVDMNAAIEKALESYEGEIRTELRKKKIRYTDVDIRDNKLFISFSDKATEFTEANEFLAEKYRQLTLETTEEGQLQTITLALSEKEIKEKQEFALQQNITTLRNRVNELGVAEPIVQRQGADRIVVQLPGIQDSAKARRILGATATLEFRMVAEDKDPYAAKESGRIPPGTRLFTERSGAPILLKKQVMLTGEYINDSSTTFDQQSGSPAVSIRLNAQGGKLFYNATKENVGKLMGVVFIETKSEVEKDADGKEFFKSVRSEKVINTAVIREALSTNFQITGLDNARSAHDLALLLRAGALAAPTTIIEERTIGPSMGQENIDHGKEAVLVGFLFVVVFMLLYYRMFGVFANLALFTNLFLIVAVLSLLQATLTLPGIAGIVLTVGMAVDANVLIFERIREELREGVGPHKAISAGYDRAFWTIFDANITTLIAGTVLFAFGTGPIKGFAVTLMVGILTSMFTAIMGTRALVNLTLGKKKIDKLSI